MDITEEIRASECEECGVGHSDATDDEGRRLCAADAAALQRRGGLDIQWDDDAPSGYELTPAVCGRCGEEVKFDEDDETWRVLGRLPTAEEADPRVCLKTPDRGMHDPAHVAAPACGHCGQLVRLAPSGLWQLAGQADHDGDDDNDECRACTVCGESPDNRHDPEGTPEDPEPAETSQCLYCLAQGPAELFEPIALRDDNVACKATACCEIRQAAERPAYYLSTLLRAVRAELAQASTAELAALAVDLTGYTEAVQAELMTREGGAAALGDEWADRLFRKARRT